MNARTVRRVRETDMAGCNSGRPVTAAERDAFVADLTSNTNALIECMNKLMARGQHDGTVAIAAVLAAARFNAHHATKGGTLPLPSVALRGLTAEFQKALARAAET